MPAKKWSTKKKFPKENEPILEDSSNIQEQEKSMNGSWSKSETYVSESASESEFASESNYVPPSGSTKETQFWTIKGGVLRRSTNEDVNRRDSWDYRVVSGDESMVIINLDLHDAVPLVKSVLGSVMDMPEIRYLRQIRWMVVFALLIMVVTLVMAAKTPTAEQIAQQIVLGNVTNTNKKPVQTQTKSENWFEFLQIPGTNTASGISAKEQPDPKIPKN